MIELWHWNECPKTGGAWMTREFVFTARVASAWGRFTWFKAPGQIKLALKLEEYVVTYLAVGERCVLEGTANR
jgi:hypothetical protein